MQVLVVGAGAMGRWFARCLRADDAHEIRFLDTDEAAARAAAEALDATVASDPPSAVDLVCIAVPIPATAAAIETYGPRAREAVVDLAGVMAEPLDAMAAAAPDCERASFHPLFAPANAPGTVAAVIAESGPAIDRVRAAMAARNDVFETDAATHDEAMATVQASAHAAVLAFGIAAESVDERFHTPVSGALFDALADVTGGESRVYADIQDTFHGADRVADAAARIADADREAFEDCYREAGEALDR